MSSPSNTVEWELSDIQRAYCNSTARYRTLVAGRRFGKNHSAIVSQADYAINPRQYDHGRDDPNDIVLWWIGPTYTQTRKYGFEKAKDALKEAEAQLGRKIIDGDPRESQPFEIDLVNGVRWEFYSYDRPQSLDGAGVDDMVIDERGYMDDSIWETNLAAMLLDTDGRVSFIGKPWFSDHFQQCFDKGQADDVDNYRSWKATSYDNPLIPDERIDEIFGDLPEQIFRREILAEFDAGGEMFTLDMLNYTPISELGDKRWNWHIYTDIGVTMDKSKARENDTDYWAAAVVCEHPRKPKAYVLDIMRRRGQSPAEAARWIDETVTSNVPTNTVHYEKVQAQEWFERELQKVGLTGVGIPENRPKEERISFLSVPFSNGNVALVDWSNTDREIDWGDFESEWLAFPSGDHDDMLDALEGALQLCNFGGEISMLAGNAYGDKEDAYEAE